MDDMLQQDLQQKQMQNTMKELRSIEKKSKGAFDDQQRMQMGQQYMTAMREGSRRMRVFGMTESTFGKLEWVSANSMRSYYEERQEAHQIHQVEESGKKKKTKQEEDAYARKGQTVTTKMKSNAGATAARIQDAYATKKKQQTTDNSEPQGTEFVEQAANATVNADLQTEAISNLLLKRDAIAARIKNAVPKTQSEKASLTYDKQLVEKINDAVKTWMLAGGVNEKGKRVSEKDKTAAAQHLPLAIESYEFHVKNRDQVIGGILMEQMKKTKEYKASYKELRARDVKASKGTLGIDQPIAGIYKDDITALRNMIAQGGAQYEENKALVQRVYEEYMQHSIAFSNLNLEVNAAQTALSKTTDTDAQNYMSKWWDMHDYESRMHELAMDAATAYIKYLLKGKQPDPTLAVYIEQHWGEKTFGPQLDTKMVDLYERKENYADKLTQRIQEIQAKTDWTQEEKDDAVKDLEECMEKSINHQAEHLLRQSDYTHAFKRYSHECDIEGYENDTGYRDVSRIMLPDDLTGFAPDIEHVKSVEKALHYLGVGTYLEDQKDADGNVIEEKKKGKPCTQEERVAGIADIMHALQNANDEIKAYVEAHEPMFGVRSLEQSYQDVDIMTGIYKKSQGVRDIAGVIRKSSVFASLPGEIRQQVLNIWKYSAAVTHMTSQRTSMLNFFREKTMRQILNDDHAEKFLSTFSKTLNDWENEIWENYQKAQS